jgi:type III secretion protein Q
MGHSVRVHWGNGETAPRNDPLQLLCAVGEARFSLSLPRTLAPVAITGPVDLATSLLIEYSWLPLMESLETLFQRPLRILPSALFDAPLVLDLALQVGDAPLQSAGLHMDAASAMLMLDVLDRCCPRSPLAFDTLPVGAQLNAGDAPLTVAQWRSLQPGDVVMLDQAADAHPSLVIGGCLQVSVQVEGSCVRLRQAPFPLNRNHPMSTPDAPDSTLDSLPLTLVCQLGSHELSLAQLREMGPGSVLPLATDSERVDLMINGRRVGQGELVRIGSGLGVRVLGLATP